MAIISCLFIKFSKTISEKYTPSNAVAGDARDRRYQHYLYRRGVWRL